MMNRRITALIYFISLLFVFFLSSYCAHDSNHAGVVDIKNKSVFNVRDHGALGDARADDTPAINQTIEACHADGGGTVLFPAGTFMVSSIHLLSNIILKIDSGAVLKSKTDGFDPWEENPFDEGVMDRAYYHIQASLMWGENLCNVKLIGPGTIDAGGLTRSSNVRSGQGDKVIALRRCENIEIADLNFIHSGEGGAHYVILLTGCDNVTISGLKIKANRDGIDLMNCRHVAISNCDINSIRYENGEPEGGDDAIKIGSDYSLGEIRPSEDITVKDCVLSAGCNGIMFGTETLGPISNCTFENIEINFAGKSGFGITSNDGSFISGLTYRNITMKNVLSPFFIKISDVKRVPRGMTYETGKISDIIFENITASDISNPINGEMTNVIWGKPNSRIENIVFRDVHITVKGGQPLSTSAVRPPENDERFPQKLIKDILRGPFPSYAYYLRHINGIRFDTCTTSFDKNDDRPAYILDEGNDAGLDKVTIQKGAGADCCVEIRELVMDFKIHDCPGLPEINESVSDRKF